MNKENALTDSNGGPTWKSLETLIAIFAIAMIAGHLLLRYAIGSTVVVWQTPLLAVLTLGGIPLVWDLTRKLLRREFGSDLLAGISIVVSVLLGEYLAGSLVVLMLSGGEALEAYAVRNASSVLRALSKRMPAVAHRRNGSTVEDIALEHVAIGDQLVVLPHESCPIDGVVIEGHGLMDESYLTGEPYMMTKSQGSQVLSGAINGETALEIRAEKLAVDSRYAKIMKVIEASEQNKPRMRRLADRLGAWYTPLAIAIGIAAWSVSGDPIRFLAVMVVATPCPLLIAIPVALIGSISLAARRAIIVRDPSALETADTCRTLILDKTGTLTYGAPSLTDQSIAKGFEPNEVLALVASLEVYSKHPLSQAVVEAAAAAGASTERAAEVSERPGQGLSGRVDGHQVQITSRTKLARDRPELLVELTPQEPGLECIILIDNRYAATYRFRDTPRADGASFVSHLEPRHQINRTLLVSGDRATEVQYLAEKVGIEQIFSDQSPEQKLAIVHRETAKANSIFVGDGINDAPALMAATVGIAFGQNSDVTTESADVVVMDSRLSKIDEFLHISRRMRRIALQSAVGGMALSTIGMLFAAAGYLPPVAGAICQELIDVLAVLNALRVSIAPTSMVDFKTTD